MNRPPFPWRAALLGTVLFLGLGLAATALEPSSEDDLHAAAPIAW